MSPETLHILFLTRWYPHKADPQLGVFIRKQAIAASYYCRVSVLNVRPDESILETIMIRKNEVHNFSETFVHYRPLANRFLNYLRFVKAHYSGYESIVKSHGKPQLMQLNVMYGLCLITLILHYSYRIPFVIAEHWHGFVDHKFRNKNIMFKKLFRFTASKAEAIITVSTFLKSGMIANEISSKYLIVPNVVESNLLIKETNSSTIKMLTVADLDDDIKNISAIIKIFIELIHSGLTSVEYHIIGAGKDEIKLKNLAQEKGLGLKNIVFHGLRSNDYVLSMLNEIDFVIINSRYETFSVIAAEALLAGKPLVCTRCGGVNDFVDESCGYLINTDSDDELKIAVTAMINDYQKYDGEKLRQKVETRFSAHTVGRQLFDIYKTTAAIN